MTREKGSEESVHKCQRKTENFQVTTLAQLSFRNSGNVEMRPSENIFSRETEACILPNSLFFDCFTISLLCSASTVNRLKNPHFSFAFLWFQLTKLSAEKSAYNWEVIGTSINTSMALINHRFPICKTCNSFIPYLILSNLINHSCDPNTFRFNMDKTSVVISSRHIRWWQRQRQNTRQRQKHKTRRAW